MWNIACLGGTGCLWSLYLFPTLFYPYCRTRMLPLAAAITMGERISWRGEGEVGMSMLPLVAAITLDERIRVGIMVSDGMWGRGEGGLEGRLMH